MTLLEFTQAYAALGPEPKTGQIDAFNKRLIRQGVDVSFLEPQVAQGKYFRTFFQVSLHRRKTAEEKMQFLEDHFYLLQDWWHTDTLPQFLGNSLTFDYALEKARGYVHSDLPYVRRWGYVLFIPRLVRDPGRIEPLFSLFHEDPEYHVVMAQAWLLSFLAMCAPERTWQYLRGCDLSYAIVGRAIQKICDSHVVPQETKEHFKSLREQRRSWTAE